MIFQKIKWKVQVILPEKENLYINKYNYKLLNSQLWIKYFPLVRDELKISLWTQAANFQYKFYCRYVIMVNEQIRYGLRGRLAHLNSGHKLRDYFIQFKNIYRRFSLYIRLKFLRIVYFLMRPLIN